MLCISNHHFSLGIYRDHVYYQALETQPTYQPLIDSIIIKSLAIALFAFGNVLVISSMYALGVTGTYLGDYFGILMDHRVTGFPFNINDNPMYNGSSLCFWQQHYGMGNQQDCRCNLCVCYV